MGAGCDRESEYGYDPDVNVYGECGGGDNGGHGDDASANANADADADGCGIWGCGGVGYADCI